MKTIHIEILDKESLERGIEELHEIKNEWQRKANICCEVIAAMLADEIDKNLHEITMTDDLKDVKTHQQVFRKDVNVAQAVGNRVLIQGTAVVFVEFGAGIYHNSGGVNNPLSESVNFDTSIGSFGKGQGNKKYWFVAHNLISCGTPAYMPIYNAIETIKPQIPTVVREIFV